jgi:hypothetical protein
MIVHKGEEYTAVMSIRASQIWKQSEAAHST